MATTDRPWCPRCLTALQLDLTAMATTCPACKRVTGLQYVEGRLVRVKEVQRRKARAA